MKRAVISVVVLLSALTTAHAVDIETVPVGNLGNVADDTGHGAVDYEYNIGKHEVTNAQYAEFLNAVDPDGSDPHDLYNVNMGSGYGGIGYDSGAAAGSKYDSLSGRGDKPVNYVSFWDACRFANWLHNGQGSGDTETGAYTLAPDGIANNTITRNENWRWAVTSEDEWYKAAYYDGSTGGYYDFATASDGMPTAESPAGTDMTNGSANYGSVIGDLTNVGAYTAKPSDSFYGTFDQAGNLWEWNEAIIGLRRGGRGGSFGDAEYGLYSTHRGDYDPAVEVDHRGFRIAEVPEPATLGLLSLGGLALLRRRGK